MNTANRAFYNVVLVLQPGEEAGKDAANIIYRYAADFVFVLIFRQIGPEIIAWIVFW